jgi:GH15 family glucan-1,4-alpha-glucosidase
MPPRSGEPDLVRVVQGLRGHVRMHMELIVRFGYGSTVPWVRRTRRGLKAIAGPDALVLDTEVELHGKHMTTVAEFTVAKGQEVPFVLMWYPSNQKRPRPLNASKIIKGTEKWWRKWSARCTYEGPYRGAVLRSLITLKAMTYAPTGGLVASPTTSLPEQLGGVRNWDYRYCWLRDATFTLLVLLLNGYKDEAVAWREWLLRAVAGDPAQANIMYGLAGERRLTEIDLDWLSGYEGAKPVRIGNAAHKQFQLDVFGEVIDAMFLGRREGMSADDNAWRVATALMDYLEGAWQKPDEGIWEVRGPRRDFVHSKVMAWVAFDRMVKAVECFGREGPQARWRKTRDAIHREICARGYDPGRNTFAQYYGAKDLDAALLNIPLVGFLPASDKRVQGTVAAIERELMEDGFVARYPTRERVDGLPPGEGKFLACSFWLADNFALLGRQDDATKLYERLLGLCNDVGLLAEEYDTKAQRLVGNFPQAFSHVGLVNTALNLTTEHGPAVARHQTARFTCTPLRSRAASSKKRLTKTSGV